MKFFDTAVVTLVSWKWGDWAESWRREARVPHWGPSWGDWWKGGDIIFVATKEKNTLLEYKYQKFLTSWHWGNWQWKDKNWRSWKDSFFYVPIGTLIKDFETGKVLYQFLEDGEQNRILEGWRWGFGNIHFKDSVNQYPEFALYGEPSRYLKVSLELQLLGDVSLIGFPSVGKSSIINAFSNAKAEVAEYPFTTKIPNLGMIKYKNDSFCMIDIPWLIEKAEEWKWLGYDFLRHILKSKVWVFVEDTFSIEKGNVYSTLLFQIFSFIKEKFNENQELGEDLEDIEFYLLEDRKLEVVAHYKNKQPQTIMTKSMIFVVNKKDTYKQEDTLSLLKEEINKDISYFLETGNIYQKNLESIENNLYFVSVFTREGLDSLIEKIYQKYKEFIYQDFVQYNPVEVSSLKKNYIKNITEDELDFLYQNWYIENKSPKVWEVCDDVFAYYVNILPWWNQQAEDWFWSKMYQLGYVNYFIREGINSGDVLKIKSPFYDKEDKYLLFNV